MKCSTTREIIDQADDPASLPYQTAAHVEGCSSCRQFASEREQLRKLLLEPRRVSAPANFETMVARRLAQRGSRNPFWLATGFYLKTAGAAGALACLLLVVQMARLNPVSPVPALDQNQAALTPTPNIIDGTVTDRQPPNGRQLANGTLKNALPWRVKKARAGMVKADPGSTLATVADITAQPRALILVRNSGSEQEIAVPMVSVGATPWVPVSVRPQDERSLRIAF